MISNNEIYNEELYEEIYNYIKSKIILQKKKKKIRLYKIKQGLIVLGGLISISFHITLLCLK
ncbi:MAG: hypothetical protein ACFFKA_14540, partial [Candidatus Thorarchaeota archaeon]